MKMNKQLSTNLSQSRSKNLLKLWLVKIVTINSFLRGNCLSKSLLIKSTMRLKRFRF